MTKICWWLADLLYRTLERDERDAVHGDFHDTVFGWMIHANVYDGKDLATIFAP